MKSRDLQGFDRATLQTKFQLSNIIFDQTNANIANTISKKFIIKEAIGLQVDDQEIDTYYLVHNLYYEQNKYFDECLSSIKNYIKKLSYETFIKDNDLRDEAVLLKADYEPVKHPFNEQVLNGVNYEITPERIIISLEKDILLDKVSLLLFAKGESFLYEVEVVDHKIVCDLHLGLGVKKYKLFLLNNNQIFSFHYDNPEVISLRPFSIMNKRIFQLSYENKGLYLSSNRLKSYVTIDDVLWQEEEITLRAKINVEDSPNECSMIFKGRKNNKVEKVEAEILEDGFVQAVVPVKEFLDERFTDIYVQIQFDSTEILCVLSKKESYFEKKCRVLEKDISIETTKAGKIVLEVIKDKSWITKRINSIRYNLIRLMVKKLNRGNKKIIFESFGGRQYSDHPRAIYEYILKNYPHMNCVWSIEPDAIKIFKENKVPYVKRFSLRWFYRMASSKYWVSNTRFPLWVEKPRDTVYLQTWHGTPLKRLGTDIDEVHMPSTNTFSYNRNFYRESRNWDYLVSPNSFCTNIFSRAFSIPKESILESGSPRNDFLVQNKNNMDTTNQIKKKYNISLNKKVILYAPTWRDDQYFEKSKYKFTNPIDLEKLKNSISDEYVIIFRMHYLVADSIDLTGYEEFAYNISTGDIAQLYLIADVLITDYSSVYFDYAVLKRPMIFFMYDLEDYRDRLRGFYLDVETSMPGPIVQTNDQLVYELKNIRGNDERLDRFIESFCKLEDGNATKRICDFIFKDNETGD